MVPASHKLHFFRDRNFLFFFLIHWKHRCGFLIVVQRNNTRKTFGNTSFCCVHMTWQKEASSEPPLCSGSEHGPNSLVFLFHLSELRHCFMFYNHRQPPFHGLMS